MKFTLFGSRKHHSINFFGKYFWKPSLITPFLLSDVDCTFSVCFDTHGWSAWSSDWSCGWMITKDVCNYQDCTTSSHSLSSLISCSKHPEDDLVVNEVHGVEKHWNNIFIISLNIELLLSTRRYLTLHWNIIFVMLSQIVWWYFKKEF